VESNGAKQGAEARTNEFRDQWVRDYARLFVWIGGIYQVVVFGNQMNMPISTADWILLLAYLGLVFLVMRATEPRILAVYVLIGSAIATALSLDSAGFLGPSGPLLCALPLCAAVLLGRRGAFVALGFCASVFAGFGALHVLGWARASPGISPRSFSSWLWIMAAFGVVVASTASLIGSVLRDLEIVSIEFEEARRGLRTAGTLRGAAEEARDRALSMRNETRSLEALGIVAGSVVHDLNNMAQVIRTWADELMRRGSGTASADAAGSIVGACDRLTNLASDVLALGQKPPISSNSMALADCLPQAARALRRFVREDIRIVVDADVPRGLPLLPLSSVDLVHLVLEAAAAMNMTAVGRGTVIISAPRAAGEECPDPPQGLRRYPALLALDLRRDGNVKSTRTWFRSLPLLGAGQEVAQTSEVRVVLWCPEHDSARLAFDLISPTPESTPSAHFRVLAAEGDAG